MTTERKIEYLERLFTPYRKKGEFRSFLLQFLEGDGKELYTKFWAPNSSSRMAFELYSGLKDDEAIKDLCFEFRLPGLASGGKGPNIDVFIETEKDIIFIESKFTERANLNFIDTGYLPKAYYAKEPYGRKGFNLVKRFYDNGWAEDFSIFCNDWEKEMVNNGWHRGCDWFEPKQETCHMSGILLWLFREKNAGRIKGKRILLYNVYWKIGEIDGNPNMSQRFEDLANDFFTNKVMARYGKKLGITDLEMGYYTVQDILQTPELLSPDIHGFGKGVNERMKEFKDLTEGQTRSSFKVK